MMPSRYSPLVATVLIGFLSAARGADEKPTVTDTKPGAFSQSYLKPPELQFSCWVTIDDTEKQLAKILAGGEPDEQLAAARALWTGRSRRHAADVLKYLAGPPPGGEGYRALQKEVDAALRPEAVLRELQKGDYLWGTWLAFLRPHADLVPVLLKGLKDRPKELPETTLALGNSGDPRALEPLLGLLQSKDEETAGFAGQALGYLGSAGAEPKLIESLDKDTWQQVMACGALAKMGSRKALPALEKLAKNDEYTGALNVKGAAARALTAIEKRAKR
jgi:hypothetical protein